MSTETKPARFLQPRTFQKVVAAVFLVSCSTAILMGALRLVQPQLFYLGELGGTYSFAHYFTSSLIVATSFIGIANSAVVLHRQPEDNEGRNLTLWLLLQSVFEISRIIHLFTCEVYIQGRGVMHLYDLIFGVVQYLVDSYLYCQIIVKT